jgi:hypothetical protein
LAASQGNENATTYRNVAPATITQEQKPVVPQGTVALTCSGEQLSGTSLVGFWAACPSAGEDGREYTIAYYKRDTRRGVDWNYTDAEGALAATTPFKYMDGTPFLKQYKLREELPSQCPVI